MVQYYHLKKIHHLIFVLACPPGKWGEDCGNECPCLNGAQCDPLSGDCTCTPGWHGNIMNSKGRLRYNIILSYIYIYIYIISWTFKFIGKQCNIKCPYGSYGQNCTEACNCQNEGSCDHISGACNCTPGWRGPM